jgi:segregation and condensation protein B
MSLKAKVEAIIYAAEEPITVEQIAQLLRDQILAEQARLESEAQAAAAAEANVADPAETSAETEAPSSDVPQETSAEAQEVSMVEDNDPTLTLSEKNGAPEEPVAESAEAVEASTPAADEPAPVETAAEVPVTENVPETEVIAEQTATETPAEAAVDEPAPAESASVGAPAAPGKRQKKSKEELAVDAKVRAHVRALIAELVADYSNEDRGIEVRQVAGGYRMSTKPEHHDVVRAFAKSLKPPVRLSLAALETLAVIAYKQPITVPEISEIRGVESGGVIATLLDRKLITTAGRKQVIGRPILYKTAKEFLLRFGLNEISELPSMEEFEKLAAEGLGGGEEQTSLDLQAPPEASNESSASPGDSGTEVDVEQPSETAPEAQLADTGVASVGEGHDSPAEEPVPTEAAEAAADHTEETQPTTEAQEPQHS